MDEKEISRTLSADEELGIMSGENVWFTRAEPKIGLEKLTLRDGPHGVRDGTPSFCYPNINLIACSWDRELLYRMGEFLGRDAKERGVNVLLAPGINIKRDPLCGRNFEYFSEDPYLTGILASEYVKGIQSRGVAACVKHFCCNNRENGRYSYSAVVDERTLREVYVKPFETVIKNADPKALMTAYNRVNGEYAAQNAKLFEILRDDLGYDGVVVSDWGGVDDRAASYACGLDLEMPGSDGKTHSEVLEAVKLGALRKSQLDKSVARIKKLADFCFSEVNSEPVGANETYLAEESMVLLKNDGFLLPLEKSARIAVAGELALSSFSQGGGCAQVKSDTDKTALAALTDTFRACDYFERPDKRMGGYDAVVVFLGVSPDSEGYDREDISLDATLLRECAKFNENTVCVLVNGSVVDLREVKLLSRAAVETYYAGQVFGDALARILCGDVDPSGRLAETFIADMSDSPCRGEENTDEIFYRERSDAGYSYYIKNKIETVFPFGYGLSYTEFAYSDPEVFPNTIGSADEKIKVSFSLTNTGDRDGKEVVQVYLKTRGENGLRAAKLVAFDKVFLRAGETKRVALEVSANELTYYDLKRGFVLPKGEFRLAVCRDAETDIFSKSVRLAPKNKADRYSTVGEIIKSERGAEIVEKYLNAAICGCITDDENYRFEIVNGHITGDTFFRKVAESLQLRQAVTMSNNKLSNGELDKIIALLNENS